MSIARILALSIPCIVMSTPWLFAQDLSKYREFQLGMSLEQVAQQARITPEPRLLHTRPGLIQELMWLPPPSESSSPEGDSARKVVFTFYNGQLFRIVVNYARARTEGLTADDMVDAISVNYGLATLPSTPIMPVLARVSTDSDRIVGHWEDTQYALNLTSSFSAFGLVMLSKRLDALARVATVEAIRLDEQEAPQREIERQQQQTEDDRAKSETARHVNKASFRP
jgi:hypothetical protein